MAWKNRGKKKTGKAPTAKPATVKPEKMTGPTTVVSPVVRKVEPRPAVEPEPVRYGGQAPKPAPLPDLASDLARDSTNALREKLDTAPPPKPTPLPEVIMVKPVRIIKQVEHYADPKLKRYPIDTPGQVDNAYGSVTSETSIDRALWGRGYMNKMADVIKARARELRLVRTWAPR